LFAILLAIFIDDGFLIDTPLARLPLASRHILPPPALILIADYISYCRHDSRH
jgi:hypothetical protein